MWAGVDGVQAADSLRSAAGAGCGDWGRQTRRGGEVRCDDRRELRVHPCLVRLPRVRGGGFDGRHRHHFPGAADNQVFNNDE